MGECNMIKGISASKGYAIGKAYVIQPAKIVSFNGMVEDAEAEKQRLTEAVEMSKQQLADLYEKLKKETGEQEAAIIESHINFLNDPEIVENALTMIETEHIFAEKAVSTVTSSLAEEFSQFDDDPYIKERAADILDVGEGIIRNLRGDFVDELANLPENTIIVAHDLKPSDTAKIDKSRVVAFVIETGGQTSHTAILARSMNITSVVGAAGITAEVKPGDTIIVDGVTGEVIINPEQATLLTYLQNKQDYEAHIDELKKLLNTQAVTKGGKRILLAANIGSVEDVDFALKNGADGIGLFRTEFLYLGRNSMPPQQEQFEVYKEVAQRMGEKPVIIRTLDIGGDKELPYLPLPKESNPFLGLRAIRLCLKEKEIFKAQLMALLRAAVYGNISIMFPMIGSMKEFLAGKAVLEECKTELRLNGVDFKEGIPVGMMIEIPSAAIMADEFAKVVDFFSIGTNDLVQYTLAVDRLNETISELYDPMNPAVLKLIKMTIDAAHAQGKLCGMCGEMAANVSAIQTLLEYGLDEFSMSAASLLEAKKAIISN
jgi:phosphotransferase system enzyme I (PtsI)